MNSKINSKLNDNSTDKKRVLFVITQSEFGGAQRFLMEFLPRLNRDKYELMVVSGTSEKSGLSEVLKRDGITTRTLPSLRRKIGPWSDFRAYLGIRTLIKDFQPDTLFLCSSKAGGLGSLAAVFPSKSGTRVIYRIGGWSFNDPRPFYQKWGLIFFEWLSSGWKDVIILNNTHDFYQAKKMGIRPGEKLALIYNGIDPYKIEFLPKEEARSIILEKIGKESGEIRNTQNIVGTIANFYPTKGLKYLIEAADNFKNDETVFVIIGDGPERRSLDKLIKEKGLEKKVFLIGRIPNARRLIAGFDIFVLPSVKEGFPWALLEAMASKVPVIASGVGAVPEMLDDGINGFVVEPAKPGQIAQKIQKIISMDDHQKQELGIQAHQTVLHKFSLEKMVEKTEELL